MNKPINICIFLCLILSIISCSSVKNVMNPPLAKGLVQYYDIEGNHVSERMYQKRLKGAYYYPIETEKGDTIIHSMIERTLTGQFSAEEINKVWKLVERCDSTHRDVDFVGVSYWHGTVPGVFPGKPDDYKIKRNRERGIYGLSKSEEHAFMSKFGTGKNISMYFKDMQLEVTTECKDENGDFWDMFFGHHVRYSSFVIVSKQGYYEAYLGESIPDQYFDAIKRVMDKSIEFEKRKD